MKKNYTADPLSAVPKLDEYDGFNLARRAPDTQGASPVGHRLFPGDDTPRTFRNCNLMNVEVPPGSTIIDCNTVIMELDIQSHIEEVAVDGQIISSKQRHNYTHHGRFNPDTGDYEYVASVPQPQDY